MRRLLGDQDRTDKLITVAFDSGFASLASFNRAFRAIKGRTPGDYRRQSVPSGTQLANAGF